MSNSNAIFLLDDSEMIYLEAEMIYLEAEKSIKVGKVRLLYNFCLFSDLVSNCPIRALYTSDHSILELKITVCKF